MDDSQLADVLESLAKKIRCGDTHTIAILAIHPDGSHEEIIRGCPFTIIGLISNLRNRTEAQLMRIPKEKNE